MRVKFYRLIFLVGLLLVCGCKKPKEDVSLLPPPDPEVCAEMEEFVYESEPQFYDYAQRAAKKGCVNRVFEALGSEPGEDWELLIAVLAKDEAKAKQIIAQGVGIGGLSLSYAVALHETSVTQEILKANISSEELWRGVLTTMLDESAEDISLALVQELVNRKFDLNYKINKCGATLWILAKSSNYPRVVQLVENNGVHPTQNDKNAALQIASLIASADRKTRGNIEAVKALVQEGADVNATPMCAKAPIYQTVKERGTPEMIALFESLGAHD